MAPSLTAIVNRAADGAWQMAESSWVQLAPIGEFAHVESGLVQVIDWAAVEGMADADKEGGTPLLVDYDHFSYSLDKPSEAAGWITALEARADGLYGQVRWTPEGEAAVRNGRYRFLSPVWLPRDVERLDGNRIRPLRLDSAGLTNNPNLRGIAPLSNRGASSADTLGSDASSDADAGRAQPNERNTMKSLMKELGLADEAAEAAGLEAIRALKNRAATAEARAATAEGKAAKLEAENAALIGGQVEADLVKYGNRFAPEKREQWKAALLANRAAAVELLESIKPATETKNAGGKPIYNRADAGTPSGDSLKGDEERAAKATAEVRAYQNRERCSFDVAWQAVKASKPELFTRTGQTA